MLYGMLAFFQDSVTSGMAPGSLGQLGAGLGAGLAAIGAGILWLILKGKGGAVYAHRTGFCLETQHYPDSPNQPTFPTTIVSAADAAMTGPQSSARGPNAT